MNRFLPIGKLPPPLLTKLLDKTAGKDPRLLLGPGIGLDCAVIENGDTLLVLKSDPITFTSDDIGWYLVQINANDIATTGATPRWLMVTLLLPEHTTTPLLVENIGDQLYEACQEIGVTIAGGHTEITHGLDRPILVGTMIGEVNREQLITPHGALSGDRLLLTKGVPIEATAILAHEFSDKLEKGTTGQAHNSGLLSRDELMLAQGYLQEPGISILREAHLATQVGIVHAMHDPTEGGLYTGLWELAEACGRSLSVDLSSVPVSSISHLICQALKLDPLAAIASGSLLIVAPAGEATKIQKALRSEGILCNDIGQVLEESDTPTVWTEEEKRSQPITRPTRDAIASLFEE